MTLILSGTDGVSDIDGTAATPAIRGTDPNTGIFFPAADTIAFAEGGAEVARMDSSGRLLIGTATSPNAGNVGQYARLFNAGNTTGANQAGIYAIARGEAATSITSGEDIGFLTFTDSAGNDFAYIQCQADANAGSGDYPSRLVFATTADGSSTVTERMRIDSSGNVGIGGAATSGYKLDIQTSGTSRFSVRDTASTGVARVVANSVDAFFGNESSTGSVIFQTQTTERGRFTNTGTLSLSENGTKGAYIKSLTALTFAASATISVSATQAGGLIVIVYDNASGSGGVFWANYSSTVTKIAGDGSATDAGSDIAVYKSAASHTTTIKNRYADTRDFWIAVYSASAVR